jgi:hypothetical protein
MITDVKRFALSSENLLAFPAINQASPRAPEICHVWEEKKPCHTTGLIDYWLLQAQGLVPTPLLGRRLGEKCGLGAAGPGFFEHGNRLGHVQNVLMERDQGGPGRAHHEVAGIHSRLQAAPQSQEGDIGNPLE